MNNGLAQRLGKNTQSATHLNYECSSYSPPYKGRWSHGQSWPAVAGWSLSLFLNWRCWRSYPGQHADETQPEEDHNNRQRQLSIGLTIVDSYVYTVSLQCTSQTDSLVSPPFQPHTYTTFFFQSSKSCWVLSFSLKESPSCFNFCPSTWLSQPFPRTASTLCR